jgi:solute carrier family 35 protein
MQVINKVTIHAVPAPIFVLFCQLFASAFTVKSAEALNLIESDPLEWSKTKAFIPVIIGFIGTLFANIKVLQHANVETFITFRSTTPLLLSVLDYAFLGRALPNIRSWICLSVLVAGAIGYLMVDADFKLNAYFWLVVWYIFFTFDAVYVKFVCDTVKMTNWGRVYYTNLLSLLPLFCAFPFMGEHGIVSQIQWDENTLLPLVLSCLCGVGMSHASYLLREKASATLFTIVGILCKILTVGINLMIWDKHASMAGLGYLTLWYVSCCETL